MLLSQEKGLKRLKVLSFEAPELCRVACKELSTLRRPQDSHLLCQIPSTQLTAVHLLLLLL